MLNFLKGLFSSAPKSPADDKVGFFLNIKCSKCQEEFHQYIKKASSLSQDYNEKGKMQYLLLKELIGGKCRTKIKVTMYFNSNSRLLSREIENGEFVD